MNTDTDGIETNIFKMIDNLLDDDEIKPKNSFKLCINGEPVDNFSTVSASDMKRKSISNKSNLHIVGNPLGFYANMMINPTPHNSTGKLLKMNSLNSGLDESDLDRSNTNFSNTIKNYSSRSRLYSEFLFDDDSEKRNSCKSIPKLDTPTIFPHMGTPFCPLDYLQNFVFPKRQVGYEDLNRLKGSFCYVLKTQNGSRILQDALTYTNSEVIWLIFEEIEEYLTELVVHLYGNYFLQKLYDYLDLNKRIHFLTKIQDDVLNIAKNHEGTFFLQTIIKSFNSKDEMYIIINAIGDKLLEIVKHENATYVVEKMIEYFEEDVMKDIIQVILTNFISLASHSFGLCVIKKLISHYKTGPMNENIQKILAENFSQLIQHQSGNYSLQEAIEKWKIESSMPIIKLFYGQFHHLSLQKYSSNAVEKCFVKGGDQVIVQFTEEVCNKTKMLELMKNQYGNYVVRKALSLSTGPTKSKLMHHVKKNLEKLTDNKLITKWRTIITQFTNTNLKVQNNSHQNSFGDSIISSNGLNSSFGSNNSYVYQPNSNVTKLSPVIQSDIKSWGSPIAINRNFLNSFTNIGNQSVNNFPSTLNAFEGKKGFDNVNSPNFNKRNVNNLNEDYMAQMNMNIFNSHTQSPNMLGASLRQQNRMVSGHSPTNRNFALQNPNAFNNLNPGFPNPSNYIPDYVINAGNSNPYNNYSQGFSTGNVNCSPGEQIYPSQSYLNKFIRK